MRRRHVFLTRVPLNWPFSKRAVTSQQRFWTSSYSPHFSRALQKCLHCLKMSKDDDCSHFSKRCRFLETFSRLENVVTFPNVFILIRKIHNTKKSSVIINALTKNVLTLWKCPRLPKCLPTKQKTVPSVVNNQFPTYLFNFTWNLSHGKQHFSDSYLFQTELKVEAFVC